MLTDVRTEKLYQKEGKNDAAYNVTKGTGSKNYTNRRQG